MNATPPGPTTSTTPCARSLTGERDGYYAEFGRVAQLAKAFHRPHVHDGDYSTSAAGASARRPTMCRRSASSSSPRTTTRSATARSATGCRPPARPLAAFCTLLSPFVPMLFMGEEYGENAPFQFFSDHIDKQIAEATREGRREEFAAFAELRRRDPRPAGPGDVRALEAHARRDPELAALYARAARRAPRAPAGRGRRDRVRRGCALAAGERGVASSSSATSPRAPLACPARRAAVRCATHASREPGRRSASSSRAAVRSADPMTERLAGPAVPARSDVGRRRAPTSRCSPSTPRASSCACSTMTTTRRGSR